MIRPEEVYKIGRIGKPHGVKGEVNLMFSDDAFDRTEAEYLILNVDGILVPFFMEEYRFRSDETALVKFCDIDTQEQARELVNCEVYFPRHLAMQDDDDLTWAAIIGFHLIDDNNQQTIGTVTDVDETTENVLFVVTTEQGDEVLIPASEELVHDVDYEERVIRMEVPDGILEL